MKLDDIAEGWFGSGMTGAIGELGDESGGISAEYEIGSLARAQKSFRDGVVEKAD